MAATSDAATDRVSRTTAPSLATVTICGWVKVGVTHAGNLFHPLMRVEAGGGTAAILGFKGAAGLTPSLYSGASTTGISGTAVTLGTWVFIAATMNGGPAQLLQTLTPGGALTKVTGTVNTSGTPDTVTLFGRSPSDGSEWLEGTAAYVRMWTAVLSDTEIQAESASATAVRTSGLWAHWALAAAALTDSSGNTRTLTAGSTALAAATDPPLGGTQAGALTIGTTAAVSLGAFADRPQTLAIGATAAMTTAPVRQTPAALSVGSTAQVGLSPVRMTTAALAVTSVAALDLQPARATAGALAIGTVSQLDLIPLVDRTAALGATSTAAVALSAFRSTAGALNVAAAIQVDVSPVPERAGALAVVTQAAVTLAPGGQTPAALVTAVTAQVAFSAVRTAPAALDVAAVAGVALAGVPERTAALGVVARAQLDVAVEREAAAALSMAVTAILSAHQEAEIPSGLPLQAGQSEPVRWLSAGVADAADVVLAGAPGPVSWLRSGPGVPA